MILYDDDKGNVYEYKTLKEIDAQNFEDKAFLCELNVIGLSEIEHYVNVINVSCPKDSFENIEMLEEDEFEDFRKFKNRTERCPTCGSRDLITITQKGDVRKILLQEPTDGIGDPQVIQGFVFGNNVNKIKTAEKVRFLCVLRSIKKKGTSTYKRVLDIYRMSDSEEKELKPNNKEIEEFKKLSKQDIVSSIAPNLFGIDNVKEGLLLSILSKNCSALMVGDPATGKTDLEAFLNEVLHKSDYVSGKSTTAAGLLAGVDNMPDGTRAARFGPVVNCHGGVVFIDEMDKMSSSDVSALHESMTTGKFSLVKVGINMKLPADTLIIGAANPAGSSKWDDEKTIRENIKLTDSLLSRFGLIYLLKDEPDETKDRDMLRAVEAESLGKTKLSLDKELLTKFINHARDINPTMSDKALSFLGEWWLDLRKVDQDIHSVAIDKRVYQDLKKLAAAYARLRFSEVIEETDSKNAIKLLNNSLLSLGMHTPGERSNALHMEKFYNKETYVKFVFREPISKSRAIIELAKHDSLNHDRAVALFDKLENTKLTEKDGEYKWVS